jgi:hypothetical protein
VGQTINKQHIVVGGWMASALQGRMVHSSGAMSVIQQLQVH